MLMRTDPIRELDRFAQQALGTAARPAVMPMDAWRKGESLIGAGYDEDVLSLRIPAAEWAKPRKISGGRGGAPTNGGKAIKA